MNKNISLSIGILLLISISTILFIKKNHQIDTSISKGSNQSVLAFSATLTEPPKQIDQTNNYYLSFDNIQAHDSESQRELDILSKGGRLITTLPADKEIKTGDKIRVRVHKDFATTRSIPPQLIGNSVISVSF
ncbi:hypothetical protein HRE23_07710 [Enterococcus faecalis]|nr:hypothetical protein [Enterococcus faecalis]NSN50598.1 hypothetical protein [Enterococcus faecalis]